MLNAALSCALTAAIVPVFAADAHVCARCHPRETDAFLSSPMGRSIAPASELPHLDPGTFVDKRASITMTDRLEHGRMIHELSRDGLKESFEISYAVGANVVGYTFLVQHGAYFFQSPLSWYRAKNGWDVTPTYELDTSVDLDREAVKGCLFCHAGSAGAIPGRSNQFEPGALTAISCERCHGAVERHLASPVPGSIVNPAKLTGAKRDNVCEQCHLEGEIRILNPGRDWWDFHAGQKLEDVFVTYVSSRAERGTKAVSQVEQLADSRCVRESGGRLWCASCHDPHGERASAASVRAVCMSCHESLFVSNQHQPAEQCISCHMPKLHADNVAHAAITDHTIPRRPTPGPEPRSGVRAWRDPDLAVRDRDLGLAMIAAGVNRQDGAMVRDGYNLLARDYRAGGSRDAEAMAALGSVLLDLKEFGQAASLFRAASALAPFTADNFYGLARALSMSGHEDEAIPELRRAIEVDPSYRNAYILLAQIYGRTGSASMRASAIEAYLRFMPSSIRFRLLLREAQ